MDGHAVSRHRETFMSPATLLPEVAMLGWSRFLAAGPHLAAHAHHAAWEICYIVRGKVDWWAGDRVYAVGPGDVYVTRPDERHGGVDALMQPCELYWVQLRPGRGRTTAFSRLAATRRRVFAGTEAIPEICERLLDEHRRRLPDSAEMVRAWLAALLLEVLRAHDAAAESEKPEVSAAVGRALAYLQANVEAGGVDDAAAAAGLGLSQFHDRFVRETGYTPGEYRARLRVERAKELLRRPGASVTRIAHALGYSTSQYFATSFRRYAGMSPGDFKKRATPRDTPWD